MLPLVGLLAVALLGMAALSVDLGFAFAQHQRLETVADAMARAALREEARLRFERVRRVATPGRFGCAPIREACIDQNVLDSAPVGAVDDIVLDVPDDATDWPPDPDVDLGPTAVSVRLTPCGAPEPMCWQATVEQATPLLFGQGSMLGFEGSSLRARRANEERGSLLPVGPPNMAGPLRTNGIPIRAVSVATTRPAIRVGRLDNGAGLPGQAPFLLELDDWSMHFPVSAFQPVVVEGDGTLTLPDVGTVGRRIGPTDALLAGRALRNGPPDSLVGPQNPYHAYVPLVDENEIVVGFGFASVIASGDELTGYTLQVERLREQLAPGNASASPRHWAALASSDRGFIGDVLAAQRTDAGFLQAPVPR